MENLDYFENILNQQFTEIRNIEQQLNDNLIFSDEDRNELQRRYIKMIKDTKNCTSFTEDTFSEYGCICNSVLELSIQRVKYLTKLKEKIEKYILTDNLLKENLCSVITDDTQRNFVMHCINNLIEQNSKVISVISCFLTHYNEVIEKLTTI